MMWLVCNEENSEGFANMKALISFLSEMVRIQVFIIPRIEKLDIVKGMRYLLFRHGSIK